MREIKFRAFNTSDKVMITDLNSPHIHHGVLVHSSDDIIMQYTGLKDKNGVEIFEGDIVRDKYDTNQVYFNVTGVYPFEYSGGGEMEDETCEVIGNIYENPEILNA